MAVGLSTSRAFLGVNTTNFFFLLLSLPKGARRLGFEMNFNNIAYVKNW
jgi:hypothetical protein